ncbi:MAG: hypothetical protein HKN43_12910 [Rhodothermales bacterium]|nr:hypothetical protein [Rhodothermales bacterium]
MQTNELPTYDMSDNPTGCCPRFKADGWDEQELHFEDKLFVKARTKSIAHFPLNMGKVFGKTFGDIEKAEAQDDANFIVMSRDPSSWRSEHFFAVTKEVPGHEMVKLSGDYLTKVFEGPFKDIPEWEREMASFVEDRSRRLKKMYFFYTTCPKCARVYGKNYVVGVGEVEPVPQMAVAN